MILSTPKPYVRYVFFFNDTATTEIYTLSLHDALPICELQRGRRKNKRCGGRNSAAASRVCGDQERCRGTRESASFLIPANTDRKSTRLNSSHQIISYAVFCL